MTLQETLTARIRNGKTAGQLHLHDGRIAIVVEQDGKHPPVRIGVEGNSISILPEALPEHPSDVEADRLRRRMTSDNVQGGSNLPPNAFTRAI